MRVRLIAVIAVAALTGASLVSCGGGDDGSTTARPAGELPHDSSEGSPEHIHGLGVQGGTLLIATHSGLWASASGSTKARRVGASEQDLMGFTVVGPDRLLASGHPAPGQPGPPNLGLLESLDDGIAWRSVSLEGEADFHVLQSSGARVYGFNGADGTLMVSGDGGKRWTPQAPPAAMFSLAIDPSDPERVVASTQAGIAVSTDAGARWRVLAADRAGLVAWPAGDRLFLIDGEGAVHASPDAGRTWSERGAIPGTPAALVADGDELYAAVEDGTVLRSRDGGRSWAVRVRT